MQIPAALDFSNANEEYAKTLSDEEKNLPEISSEKTIIVTCMDARIDTSKALGLKPGQAYVVRNAGGRATEALRSIIISQHYLKTRRIAIFHHTDCGMGPPELNGTHPGGVQLTDPLIRNDLKAHAPGDKAYIDQLAFLPFTDLEQSVKEDVEFLTDHPLLIDGTHVSGWIHDIRTGLVRRIV